MNEIEEWFLGEFGHLGFSVTPTLYDVASLTPFRKVIYENTPVPNIRITPELIDISASYNDDSMHLVKQLIVEKILIFLREINKDKDFKPIQKLNKFKL
jgi:hypothetical protein